MSVAALIPVKGFINAKQRLAGILGARERALLAETMFRDTLSQARQARAFDTVFVVTSSREVAQIATALGASVITERDEKGETEAVAFGLAVIKAKGIQALLVIPADIPLLRAADLESLCEQQLRAPSVLLVPSHDKMGTNALLLSPPDVLRLRFGYDSFSYHLSEVAAKGLPLRVVENERIALDVDEPRDLERFLSTAGAGEAHSTAVKMGLAAGSYNAHRSGRL